MEVLSLQVIDLPADILFTVLGFLDPISLLSFSLTCRRMWKLLKSENNELWKYSCPWTRDLSDEAFVKICRQGEGEFIRVYSALMRIRKTTRRYRCSRQVRQKLKDNQSDDESALFSRSFRKTCLKQYVKVFGILIPKLSSKDIQFLLLGNSLCKNDGWISRGFQHETCFGSNLFTLQVFRAFGTIYTEDEPCFEVCYDEQGVMISASVNKKAVVENDSRDLHDVYDLMEEKSDEFANVGMVGTSRLVLDDFLRERELYPFSSPLSASVVLSGIIRHIIDRNKNRYELLKRVSILRNGSSSSSRVRAQVQKSIQFAQSAGFPVLDLSKTQGITSKKELETVLHDLRRVAVHCKSGSGTAYLCGCIGATCRELDKLREDEVDPPFILVLPGLVNSSKSARKGRTTSSQGADIIRTYLRHVRQTLQEVSSLKQVIILTSSFVDFELYNNIIFTCFEDNIFPSLKV